MASKFKIGERIETTSKRVCPEGGNTGVITNIRPDSQWGYTIEVKMDDCSIHTDYCDGLFENHPHWLEHLHKAGYSNQKACECGGTKLRLPHSHWCPKHEGDPHG